MSGVTFDLSQPQVKQQWETKTIIGIQKNVTILNPENRLIGESDEHMIQRRLEPWTSRGSQSRITIIRPPRGRGAYGGQTLRETEKGIESKTFDWQINTLRWANAVLNFPVSIQRVPWDVWEETTSQHAEYWPNVMEFGLCAHLVGCNYDCRTEQEWYADGTDLFFTMSNPVVVADTKHFFRYGGIADDLAISLDPSHIFQYTWLSQMKTIATHLANPIRRCKTPWGKLYVALIHGYGVRHIKNSPQHWAYAQATLQGGKVDGNPIWEGALFQHDGCLALECNFLPVGNVGGAGGTNYRNVRRGVFCGAQAAVLGFAKETPNENTFRKVTENWDYEANRGFASRTFLGAAAPYFEIVEQGTTERHATITFSSYAEELVTSA